MSFLERATTELRNTLSDAYGSLVYGDDAGAPSVLVLILHPPASDLCFLEVNGRAYVSSVAPDGDASSAGVAPRDAVQLAVPLSDTSWSERRAAAHALTLERRGLRTSHADLLALLGNGGAAPRVDRGLSTSFDAEDSASSPAASPAREDRGGGRHPVAVVFRRTRKRTSAAGLGSPGAAVPGFRMDDECDRAAALVRKLAPPPADSADAPSATTEAHSWDNAMHDATNFLLGEKFLPQAKETRSVPVSPVSGHKKEEMEKAVRKGIGSRRHIRRWSSSEAMAHDRWKTLDSPPIDGGVVLGGDDKAMETVETSTVRKMIQKAVGLAFMRTSKMVFGMSIHGGSGVVIARLPDGTWSAPSAIGTWGIGFGLQFGLEVSDFIFILQTEDAVEHFRQGGHFTVGGNVGAAVAGVGREAYGAASLQTPSFCTSPNNQTLDDDDPSIAPHTAEVAPIVAYAQSRGLYFGVSVVGTKIFTRNDINEKVYKFTTGSEVTARDILGGKVATPPEADDLYASLHRIEVAREAHEFYPPETLRPNSRRDWLHNRPCPDDLFPEHERRETRTPVRPVVASFLLHHPPRPLQTAAADAAHDRCAEELAVFETKFKKFLYGGVTVQRLVPDAAPVGGKTRRERRTLWLMLPEVGSLRLGFISKVNDGGKRVTPAGCGNPISQVHASLALSPGVPGRFSPHGAGDDYTEAGQSIISEDTRGYSVVSEDDGRSVASPDDRSRTKTSKVRLSSRHSIALTDVTCLTIEPKACIHWDPDDATEHLRVISVQDHKGCTLLFLADTFREAELLACGLKLLIERETARLGVRGGRPRGGDGGGGRASPPRMREGEDPEPPLEETAREEEGRGDIDTSFAWSAGSPDPRPPFVLGHPVAQEVVTGAVVLLPLPLCRALLFDSSSPVVERWEASRGDRGFHKTPWDFVPASLRPENFARLTEQQLISAGCMAGACRNVAYNRLRREVVRLTEKHAVEIDEPDGLMYTITEQTPRRGFGVNIRIIIQALGPKSCELSIVAELRPMGKNLSDQMAVNKAFQMVVAEISMRYGNETKGLLKAYFDLNSSFVVPETAVFAHPSSSRLHLIPPSPENTFHFPGETFRVPEDSPQLQYYVTAPPRPTCLTCAAPLSHGPVVDQNVSPLADRPRPVSPHHKENSSSHPPRPPPLRPMPRPPRPTEAEGPLRLRQDRLNTLLPVSAEREHGKREWPEQGRGKGPAMVSPSRQEESATIRIKPLPRIRLNLMPSPRETDEDDVSGTSLSQR